MYMLKIFKNFKTHRSSDYEEINLKFPKQPTAISNSQRTLKFS